MRTFRLISETLGNLRRLGFTIDLMARPITGLLTPVVPWLGQQRAPTLCLLAETFEALGRGFFASH
jgi:hypothetical protein